MPFFTCKWGQRETEQATHRGKPAHARCVILTESQAQFPCLGLTFNSFIIRSNSHQEPERTRLSGPGA